MMPVYKVKFALDANDVHEVHVILPAKDVKDASEKAKSLLGWKTPEHDRWICISASTKLDT